MGFYQIRYNDGYDICRIVESSDKREAIERFGELSIDGGAGGSVITVDQFYAEVDTMVGAGMALEDANFYMDSSFVEIPGTSYMLDVGYNMENIVVTDATRQVDSTLNSIRIGDRFDSPYDGSPFKVNGPATAEEVIYGDTPLSWLLIRIPVFDERMGWDTEDQILCPAEWFDGRTAIYGDDIYTEGRPFR